ncbi:hypothetical protein [Bryocella elongata]|nr:hypothetical protein [Bryocella elongata]
MKHEVQGIPVSLIEDQLKRLETDPLFSNSRRYPSFLGFVVRKTLEGHEDELKERTIGIQAFGRVNTYDLSADPVVRVTAGEVRKRLAQYYYDAAHQSELRIELRPGSYVPDFRLPAAPQAEPSEGAQTSLVHEPAPLVLPPNSPTILAPAIATAAVPANSVRWRSIAIGLALALVVALVGDALPLLHRTSATDSFWSPITGAGAPVLISVGSVVAMVNSNAVAPPPDTVSGHPLASDPIAVSDATALSSIQQVLSARSRTSTLKSSTSTTFSDLQQGPVVLISGFNNLWTVRITEPLRFRLARLSTDDYAIQDQRDPTNRKWAINTATPFDKIGHDFGLVARFHDPTTEQIVVVAAGIGENGTIAASRLLTDERYLAELKRAGIFPRPDQNFECIVETQMIDGKPGPPRIVDSYIW